MPDWTTQTEWAFPAPDRRLIQPITSVDTGSRPLNFLLNKILLPWSNAAAFSTNVKLAMIIGLEDALRDIDDALSHSIFGQEYRAAQALLPMNAAMGLAIEVGPAMEFMAAQMTTWWSTFSRSPRVLNAFLFPVFSTLGADTGSISSLGRAIEGTLPPESFAGVINEAEFSSHPAVIDRLSRARQFDVGGYKSLTGKGEYGRPFDHLDSDEALQNAFVRNVRDVNRTDPMLADNPATALSPALHQQIRNLTAVEMEGMSAEQVLRFHIEQMRPFTPDYVLVVLENLSLAYIRMNGL
ncbi:hypothetical protein [Bradyrhizobium sp. Rc2d]|uniref:hypothetical protein n=1 Tax=Bradyrhizobium sp. Rc2d TaxID=1855321 RepID=UPI00115FD85E|nr:hypothetical protein [Bradyrhizobium sp. Rc2d]